MQTKSFPTLDILSVIMDRKLSSSPGLNAPKEVCGWMTNRTIDELQLVELMDYCKIRLLKWFPDLAMALACELKLDGWLKRSPTCPEEGIKIWFAELKMLFPKIKDQYDVPRI